MLDTISEKKKIKSFLTSREPYNLYLDHFYCLKSSNKKERTLTQSTEKKLYSKTYLNHKHVDKIDLRTFFLKIPIDCIFPNNKRPYFIVYRFNKRENSNLYFKVEGLTPLFTTIKNEHYSTNFETIYRSKENNVKLTMKILYKDCSQKKITKLRHIVQDRTKQFVDAIVKKNENKEDLFYELCYEVLNKELQKHIFNGLVEETNNIKNVLVVKCVPCDSNL